MEEESVRSDASHEGSPELYDERDDRQQEYSLQGEESAHRVPEMDEEDVLEMSVLAAQIESAEDFNLTFEVGLVLEVDLLKYFFDIVRCGSSKINSRVPRIYRRFTCILLFP